MYKLHHKLNKDSFSLTVYGTYDDVSLNAFVEVQLNSNFRTEWDDTALQLRVLDSDQGSNSELVYWLVKFPVSIYTKVPMFDNCISLVQPCRCVILAVIG